MQDPTQPTSVLFMTVGMGNPKQLEETLLAPASKSIKQGPWDVVVLLPSAATAESAEKLRQRHPDKDFYIRPLPAEGDEYNPDRCYEHFDAVLREFIPATRGTIGVDMTRGTKAMSAALLLAGFRHGVDLARYLQAQTAPDQAPVVIPGTERVVDVPMQQARRDQVLDQAALLMNRGDFAAAATLLEQEGGDDLEPLARLARFYAAWDRLDYESADRITPPRHLPESWARYAVSEREREWVHALACPLPSPEDPDYAPRMAAYLRRVIVDLWANGLRRVRQQQFEDAVIRAYRVLELLGQARLFDYGLDSGWLPPDHPAVSRLMQRLKESGSPSLTENRDGTLKAAREQVARLLKYLGDPLAKALLACAQQGEFSVLQRNHSLLIHGYHAVSPQDESALMEAYARIEVIIREDRKLRHEDAERDFAVARAPELMGTQ